MEQEFEICKRPVDLFLNFWDSNIEDNIVTPSNFYVSQMNRAVPAFTLPDFKPPKMERPLASPCPSPVPGKKKRRKNTDWSVSDAVRLEQVGLQRGCSTLCTKRQEEGLRSVVARASNNGCTANVTFVMFISLQTRGTKCFL
ncbi:hypothetical protein ElyMa_000818500 [Elysia marginata]|uniref:Uncharacterized protein n=1 Tax=Elysia marginata TaxID=1093978 RepID=A0AAV4GZ61_9GAST|nr:hypothetical protein ElyMa_000818500 [Elysia marginata]